MNEEIKVSIFEKILVRLFAAWCFATVCVTLPIRETMYDFVSIELINGSDIIYYIAWAFSMITLADIGLRRIIKKETYIDIVFFVTAVVVFGVNSVFRVKDAYLSISVICGVCFCLYYVVKKHGYKLENRDIKLRTVSLITALVAIYTFVLMLVLIMARYKTFHTSTFDFGIFTQMFHNMKETGLPMTTCERNELLSHFSVHVSPIYYLILPIYMLFPYNETLLIFQLLFIVSGVIPLVLICKNRKLSNTIILAIAVVYLLSPVLFGGLFYDFHENKFLTTLILWLMYFVDKDKKIGIYIFAILVLMVKEDAGIYVASIALYMIATKKKNMEKIHGIILLGISVIWFLVAYSWLNNGGDGAMTGRYKNFIGEEESVFAIISTIIKNPSYFFRQLLSVEKLENILWVIVPVVFMPFRVKSVKELILLIPFLVINLMPSYVYQYNISHQYFYGSFALMLYLIVVNIEELKFMQRITVSMCMMVASLIMFTSFVTDKFFYLDEYKEKKEQYEKVQAVLEDIPDNASVSVTTYYMPPISMREEVYRYPAGEDCEYIVFDMRNASNIAVYTNDANKLQENGYEKVCDITGSIMILKKR